jgi:MFS family permease
MQNIWKLRFFCFFQSLIPAYVIERLYWEQRGMTVADVVYTEIIYAITILILEVPTGILADQWKRKNMMIISATVGCLEFFLLLYASSFWHFALVVCMAGISYSFQSGSVNALLYETLAENNQTIQFEKELGLLEVCQLVAAIIAAFCGSLLANYYPFEINYWLSFISTILAFGFSIYFVEPKINQTPTQKPSLWVYTKEALSFFRKRPKLMWMISTGMILGASFNFIEEFWQLYVNAISIPIFYFGIFSAICMLLQIPGNLFVPWLLNKFQPSSIFILIQFIFAFGLSYIALIQHFSSLIVLFLLFFVSSITMPIVTGHLHHQIESSKRATMDSFQSLGENIVIMVMGLGFGYICSIGDIFDGFGFLACLCIFYLFSYLIFANRFPSK